MSHRNPQYGGTKLSILKNKGTPDQRWIPVYQRDFNSNPP